MIELYYVIPLIPLPLKTLYLLTNNEIFKKSSNGITGITYSVIEKTDFMKILRQSVYCTSKVLSFDRDCYLCAFSSYNIFVNVEHTSVCN